MEKQKVRLTESQLRSLIKQCVNEAIEEMGKEPQMEDSLEEGLGNQLRTGAKALFHRDANSGNQDLNLRKRINAAKTGFQQQGVVDNIDNVVGMLKQLVDNGKINPNQTVAQLLHSGGRFQKGSLGQMRAQANSRISQSRNRIYK